MLKKRCAAIFLAVLSFFIFIFQETVLGAKTEYTLPDSVISNRLSIYMNSVKVEPVGGVTSAKLSCNGSKNEALKLYDGDIATAPMWDTNTTVTLDMGVNILFSQIRYYVTKVDEAGNNCFGTRFYASKDNRNYTELAVSEGTSVPEDSWQEVDFSGFGEYRYFRVELPARANISEIQWMGVEGFSKTRQADGKYSVSLDLSGYNEGRAVDTTIVTSVFNKNGVMKQGKLSEQTFSENGITDFTLNIDGITDETGDSYRVAVFDEKGSSPIPAALVYRENDASAKFSVASVFSNNMLLQADEPVTVWGKGPKNSTIEVKMTNDLGGEIIRTAKVGGNSEWEVNLGSFSSGGSYTLIVNGDGKSAEYKNITFGDVWLCTGQSNMDYYMMAGEETAQELENYAEVMNSDIRVYSLWNKGIDGAAMPVDNLPCDGVSWREAASDTVAYCSAIGYYFAKDIQETTGEPVGIIHVAVGDTEINRWTEKGLKNGSYTCTDGDLYNNRIAPLEKLKIKGIIMYQGEADQYRTHMTATQYSDAMAGLVDSYRDIWGEDLPFYWAQLARYSVDESYVRQGQLMALDKVSEKKNTGMIALTDVFGNYKSGTGNCRDDIHPWGKKIVAERFAAYAKRDCYGVDVAVTGPTYVSSKTEGRKLILTFDCTGALRLMPKEQYADEITDNKIKRGELNPTKAMEFEIAGADKKFYEANAKLEGNTVTLTCDSVSNPVYARYAWGSYPEMPNLTDDTGLPVAVFTTEPLE